MPNFTPVGWWECDIWSVTKAGYAVEHEIKLSVSDFHADAKKRDACTNKHKLLAIGNARGPSRFWFVFAGQWVVGPSLDEWCVSGVPAWAGIKIAELVGDGPRFRLVIHRPAPKLHQWKAEVRQLERAREACYWRFWRERGRAEALAGQLRAAELPPVRT